MELHEHNEDRDGENNDTEWEHKLDEKNGMLEKQQLAGKEISTSKAKSWLTWVNTIAVFGVYYSTVVLILYYLLSTRPIADVK